MSASDDLLNKVDCRLEKKQVSSKSEEEDIQIDGLPYITMDVIEKLCFRGWRRCERRRVTLAKRTMTLNFIDTIAQSMTRHNRRILAAKREQLARQSSTPSDIQVLKVEDVTEKKLVSNSVNANELGAEDHGKNSSQSENDGYGTKNDESQVESKDESKDESKKDPKEEKPKGDESKDKPKDELKEVQPRKVQAKRVPITCEGITELDQSSMPSHTRVLKIEDVAEKNIVSVSANTNRLGAKNNDKKSCESEEKPKGDDLKEKSQDNTPKDYEPKLGLLAWAVAGPYTKPALSALCEANYSRLFSVFGTQNGSGRCILEKMFNEFLTKNWTPLQLLSILPYSEPSAIKDKTVVEIWAVSGPNKKPAILTSSIHNRKEKSEPNEPKGEDSEKRSTDKTSQE